MQNSIHKTLLAGILLFLTGFVGWALPPPTTPANIDHSSWNSLLEEHVDNQGWVDYQGFSSDREKLQGYLQYLAQKKPAQHADPAVILAFYINLYNAAMVERVLEHYPVASVKDIKRVWGKKVIPVGEELLSLNDIEHGILRKMDEPRIHFAINCASISCPKLSDRAFLPQTLDAQLDEAAKAFILSDKNQLQGLELGLSQIFNWYKKDFRVAGKADPLGYINRYLDQPVDPKSKTHYLEYNWNLNEQR